MWLQHEQPIQNRSLLFKNGDLSTLGINLISKGSVRTFVLVASIYIFDLWVEIGLFFYFLLMLDLTFYHVTYRNGREEIKNIN